MKIGIIRYNAGNTLSVYLALQRLGYQAEISDDADLLNNCDKLIFPGVGEASSAMSYLKKTGIDNLISNWKKPLLGICLGLQLLCKHTEEGETDCLGIFSAEVKRFRNAIKVPQIGWNQVVFTESRLWLGSEASDFFYFVHSYAAEISADTKAITNYGNSFSAVLEKDNFFAVQFHPEKSSKAGAKLLKNFVEL